MVVWGGLDGTGSAVGTGAMYDPATDTWATIDPANAPAASDQFAAVWAGAGTNAMMMWGGTSGANAAFAFSPSTGWTMGSTTSAPPSRTYASAVWTGNAPENGAPASRLVVWGGQLTNAGGVWDGATWSPTSLIGAPSARRWHGAVYTGNTGNALSSNLMLIWGGYNGGMLGDGAIYDVKSDTWRPMSSVNAPVPFYDLGAFWTGSKMIIMAWQSVKTYDPVTDAWSSFDDVAVQGIARYGAKAWTGTNLIVWGGEGSVQAGSIAYP